MQLINVFVFGVVCRSPRKICKNELKVCVPPLWHQPVKKHIEAMRQLQSDLFDHRGGKA